MSGQSEQRGWVSRLLPLPVPLRFPVLVRLLGTAFTVAAAIAAGIHITRRIAADPQEEDPRMLPLFVRRNLRAMAYQLHPMRARAGNFRYAAAAPFRHDAPLLDGHRLLLATPLVAAPPRRVLLLAAPQGAGLLLAGPTGASLLRGGVPLLPVPPVGVVLPHAAPGLLRAATPIGGLLRAAQIGPVARSPPKEEDLRQKDVKAQTKTTNECEGSPKTTECSLAEANHDGLCEDKVTDKVTGASTGDKDKAPLPEPSERTVSEKEVDADKSPKKAKQGDESIGTLHKSFASSLRPDDKLGR